MPDRKVRVLLVDDSRETGVALKRWLERSADFEFVGHATELKGALDAVGSQDPNLVLVDLDIPGMDTLAFVRRLTELNPGPRVAMLSAYTDGQDVRRSLDAGALGYLSKFDPPATIASAIKLISEGNLMLSKRADRALQRLDTGGREPSGK